MSPSGVLSRVGFCLALLQLASPPAVQAANGLPNIAVDPNGNTYIASTTPLAHLVVTKVTAAGTATAVADLGAGSRLEAIAADNGFFYVGYTKSTGFSTAEKYDATGGLKFSVDLGATNRLEGLRVNTGGELYLVWTSAVAHVQLERHLADGNRFYLFDRGADTQFHGMAYDGGLYAAITTGAANLTIQRVSNGSPAVITTTSLGVGSQLNAFLPDGSDGAFASYVDAAGHLQIGRFDATGAQVFLNDLGAGSRPDRMVKDTANNVYLLWTSAAGHLFVSKYSSAGALSASIDQGAGFQPVGLAVDGAGNYFAASVSNTGVLAINKYDAANTALTPVSLGAGAQLNNMTTDAGGALYLLWTSNTAHLQATRYDNAGTLGYTLDLGKGSQSSGTAVTSAGVLLAEVTTSAGHLTTASYDTAGNAAYSVDLGAGVRSSGAPFDVSGNLVDPGGNAYLSTVAGGGAQTIAKYNPGGGAIHTRTFSPVYPKALSAVDGAGNSYTAFFSSGLTLEKRNAGGTVAYAQALLNGSSLQALSVDPAGDAYVGWGDSGGAAFFDKYDASGTLGYHFSLGAGATLWAAAVDTAGYAYLGYSNAGGWFLTKLDPAGGTGYSVTLGANTIFGAMALDSAGNTFLGYFDNSGAFSLTKYNFHGDVVFTSAMGTGIRLYALLADAAGYAYLAYGDGTGLHLTKKDAGGTALFATNGVAISVFNGLSVDAVGNSYLGYTTAGGIARVDKYNFARTAGGSYSGGLLYSLNLGAGSSLSFVGSDAAANAYVAYTDPAGQLNFNKYNPIGAADFALNLGAGSQIGAAASDASGNGYIGYTGNSGAVTFARYHSGGGLVYGLALGTGTRFALTGASLFLANTADAASVPRLTDIGYTVTLNNTAVAGAEAANGASLVDTLPAGIGINWSISPPYTGPGSCSIVGAVGSQSLRCSLGSLRPQAGVSVHLSSTTTTSSCASYPSTASFTAVNGTTAAGTQGPGSATINVTCSTANLVVIKTHVGSFIRGQHNAAYYITISNTVGSQPTSGAVTLTESVPVGLTLVSMSGAGWTCPAAGTTCTRSDVLPAGGSYPPITALVNVAANAAALVVNQATVSGGGAVNDTAGDPTSILDAFTDVAANNPFLDAINLMRQYSITAGCGTGSTYCPVDNVTRAQMAIFIIRAVLGGDNFTFSATPHFTDVPANAFGFKWIQKMQELGITAGCGGGNYCPDSFVTRGQMAIFIIRARLGPAADATFTYPGAPLFTDVPANDPSFKWIQRMKVDSITAGCGTGTTYCPTDAVTREQMSIFIMRGAFNFLLPIGTPVATEVSVPQVSAGQVIAVIIRGLNTHFAQGSTQVNAGPGITASNVAVVDAVTLTVQLTVAGNAASGPRTLVVTTGAEEAVLPNGLTVQ